MFLFAGYFLGSRRTLENFFVRIERAWNGVVFDKKIFRGQSLCVCRRALEIFIKFDFFRYTFWGIVLRTGSESRNIQLRHSALLILVWKGLGFIAKIFLAGVMSLTGYTRRYYRHWCQRNLCTPWHTSDTSSSIVIVKAAVKVLVTGNELPVVVCLWRSGTTIV